MLSSSIESWLRTTVLLTLSLPLNAVALPAQDPQPSGGAQDALDSSSASRALNGPVTQGMFADPAVMKVDNTYYAYATNVGNKRVPIATSRNFKDWEITDQDALPGPLPAWVDQGEGQSLWGPDVYQPARNQMHPSHRHSQLTFFRSRQETSSSTLPQPSSTPTKNAVSASRPPTPPPDHSSPKAINPSSVATTPS